MVKAADNQRFDPRRHITAGELRRLGFYLSEMIPDGAYVRRVAVGFDGNEDMNDGSATLSLNVLEPFVDVEELELMGV